MLTKTMLAFAAAAALFHGTPGEGEAWLKEAESHLYSWPKTGAVIRFQVKTDVVDTMIARIKKDLPPNPDPQAQKVIDALKRIRITGSVDTETGKATADVQIPYETDDPNRQAMLEKMKQGIVTMVTKCFEGIPFHDSSLCGKGRSVAEAEAKSDTITVKLTGGEAKEASMIRLDRRRMLPEYFESDKLKMKVRYAEVVPGKFAPASMEVQMPDNSKSTAAFTYQRVGELVFPSTVKVELGAVKAKLEFLSVHVDPSGS
jgi:hypothetical protein